MAIALDLITSNPALDAYQKAEELALKAELQDQKMRQSIREEREAQETYGTRLRKLEADTSGAEVRTQAAKDELPYVAPKAATSLRQAKATADITEAEARVAPEKAQIGLRRSRADAQNTELAPFYKSIELLEKGDIDGARLIANHSNMTIPEEFLNDAELRSEVVRAAKEASQLYDKRPQDQQAFIKGRITAAMERRQRGERASDPRAAYDAPGAPVPQETSDFRSRFEMLPTARKNPETGEQENGYLQHDRSSGDHEFVSGFTAQGRGGLRGAGAGASSATERIITELMQRGHSYEESLAMAKRAPNADAMALRREGLALQAAKADPTYMTNPAQTIQKYRKEYGISTDAPVAPKPPPGPQSSVAPPTVISSTPTAGPTTSPQRPDLMSPGNGQKPIDIQAPPLPANLPQGVQYSWSPARQQFRDELGRVYDRNGNPV